MARQSTRARSNDRSPDVSNSPVRRRSFRLNDEESNASEVVNFRAKSSGVRQLPLVGRVQKDYKKSKQMVSAASVFQRDSRETHRDKRGRRRRELTPVPDLYLEFQDVIEDVQDAVGEDMKATFDNVFVSLSKKLLTSKIKDQKTFEMVSEMAAMLGATLVDEKVEIRVKKNGKIHKETVRIGDRFLEFKKTIGKEKSKLQDYWKQWDEVQNEYFELGIQVFGKEPFHEGVGDEVRDGYEKEMELLALNQKSEAEKLNDEVKNMTIEIIEKIKKSEKELDAMVKKEQTKLIQQLLG